MRHAVGTLARLGLCAVLGLAAAGVRAQEGTTLHDAAAATGNVDLLRTLLDKGAAVDAVDADGGTPLHYAAGRGHETAVRLLLARGAAVDAKAPGGKTALSFAAEQGHLDLHVSFRESGGRWGQAVPLGPEVNTPAREMLPVVSPDGKALFFLRGWVAYWVDVGVVAQLRPPPRRD